MFNTSHLIEYLTNLPLLQVPSSLLQASLNEGLRIGRTDTGMVIFFDYDEGREAGGEVGLLRYFLSIKAAKAQSQLNQEIPISEQNPLSSWVPKLPTLYEMSFSQEQTRRILTLPLGNPNSIQPMGVVLLLMPRTDPGGTISLTISTSDLPNLVAYCRATANAWSSLRSLTNMSRRLEDLVLLNDVATAITQNRDLSDLLRQIMDTTAQMLHSDACTLMLLDRATNELVFSIPTGEAGNELKQMRQPMSEGISGYVARIGEPVIVNDVTKDRRFNQSVDNKTGFRTRSIMCAPMIVREKTIGVIEVINKQDGGSFNPNDLALLLTLAAQSAIAIENAQLYSDLKDERDKIIAKEEEVRRELGRDLHDGPAQVMAGLAMRSNFIKKLYQAGNEETRLLKELTDMERVAQQAAKDIRTMMFGLRPLMLETKGLIPTLEAYVEKLQTEGWETHLIVEGFGETETESALRLPYNTEATVFIIIQEAINNIRKHAQPNNVWISLSHNDIQTIVTVRDDGKGFDSEATAKNYIERGSFGLLNMRERARLINAQYELSSKLGQGTTIKLLIPNSAMPQVTTQPLMVTMPSIIEK
ncbi:GAF domain-containing sensor histidine kinase [Candidatus Chlorohelix sp.]|uniref:GAF domain-containing sensor histidine kinase n=1 Tax=Candidatus Chlorohelix sp. TaxID=3139201 RepID=UPI00306F8C7B